MKKLILIPLLCVSYLSLAQMSDSARVLSYYNQAVQHYISGQKDSAIIPLDTMEVESKELAFYVYYINALLFKAKIYIELRDFVPAVHTSLFMLEEAKTYLSPDNSLFLNIYSNLSALFAIKSEDDHRDMYLLEAKKWMATYGKSGPSFSTYINLIKNVGVFSLDAGDFYAAIEYQKQVLELLADSLDNSSFYVQVASYAHENMGSAYVGLEQYQTGINSFHTALALLSTHKLLSPEAKNRIKRRMAFAYKELGNPDQAIRLCEEVLANQDYYKSVQQKEFDQAMIYHTLGQCYTSKSAYDQAEPILKKALELRTSYYAKHEGLNRHPEVGGTQYRLAELFRQKEDLPQALEHLQKALIQHSSLFHDLDVQANPELEDLEITAFYLADILSAKAEILFEKSRVSSNMEGLLASYRTYTLLISLIDRDRKRYKAERSKLFLLAHARPAFEGAISLAVHLYQKTGEEKYANQAFEWMEKSKAVLLYAALKEVEARTRSLIPDSLISKELAVQKKWDEVKEQRYKAQNQASPDQNLISNLNQEIFDLKQELDELQEQLEAIYPQYFALKNSKESLRIADVQAYLRRENQQVIEFYVGKEHIYLLNIQPKSFSLHTLKRDSTYDTLLQGVLDELQGLVPVQLSQFRENSQKLHQLILSPIPLNQGPENVIFITDDKLGYLPFEILIPEQGASRYLIEDFSISYAYSANLLFNNPIDRIESRGSSKHWLGYAPVYTGDEFLAYNQDEIQGIYEIFSGEARIGQTATANDYLRYSDQFSILHLAAHAYLDAEDPMYSYLLFTPDSLHKEGKLYAYEVFNQELSADLVVLSACQTGYGPIVTGEGILSLARAFRYAGSSSILMNLWKTDGSISMGLMQDFYLNLDKGLNKDQALRKAKLDFLQKAPPNRLSPRFWANFILIGETVSPQKMTWKFWGFILLGLALTGIVFIFFKKNLSKMIRSPS